MELSAHLQELRKRILICVVVFSAVALAAFYQAENLWSILKRPLTGSDLVTLVNLTPAEGISASLLSAGIFAAIVTSPITLYHIYAFCLPAVSKNRHRTFLLSFLSATVLFFAGSAFAYFLAIPMLFSLLANYSTAAVQLWSQESYLSFLFRFEIIFALLFQMPVAATVLARTGIFDRNFLARHFRIVIFLSALFSAIVTPPDLLSLFWVEVPMLALYGISLVAYRAAWRPK